MAFAAVHKLQIYPLNQRDSYSFKEGNPIINLQIGRQNGYVNTGDVYLNFRLQVKSPEGQKPDNKHTGGDADKSIHMNSRVGAWSIIDRVTISEASRNQTIEGVRDIGRVLAAVRPASVSALDYNTKLNLMSLSGSRKYMTNLMLNNEGVDVSLRLADVSGFMQAGVVPLNQIPLNISVQLAPDAQALQTVTSVTKNKMTYSISDVFLSADLLIPTAPLPASFEASFDSYTTVYNVQNSSNQTTSLSLGLGSVKSVFTTVSEPEDQNNFAKDSFSTGEFLKTGGNAVIDRVSFLRASQNYPIENELELNAQSAAKLPLTPLLKHGLRSIGRWNARSVQQTLTGPPTQVGLVTDTMFDGQPFAPLSSISHTQGERLRIYGVDLDSYSNAGLNFRDVTYGLRVNMDGAVPMGLHTTAIARHTVMVKDSAVTVVS